MQDKDSEALRNQRKRRKRVGRIKNAIVMIIAGWIMISMLLIIVLFVRTVSLERKIDSLIQTNSIVSGENSDIDDSQGSSGEVFAASLETEGTQEVSVPSVSAVEDAWNLAEEGDIHRVYLTFDGGPSENTDAILDILAEYDVKATFFVVGMEDEESRAIYRRIVDEGHTLGMNSYSNKYSIIYKSEEAFKQDYQKLADYLYEVTGTRPQYYRFPGGSSNQISNVSMGALIQFLNSQDVVYYDWNVSAGDAASVAFTADEIVENVTEDVVKYKTSVVLLHDSADKSETVEAIRPLIEALQNMDAEILPIDEDTQVIQYVKPDSAE